MEFIGDMETGVIVTVAFQFITVNLLILGLKFHRISQSVVRFTDDKIQVLDSKGNCWREIDYSTITTVRAEFIADFFYGQSKKAFRFKYICLYLNGATSIPNVPFAKLFKGKNFFMFNYCDEALQFLEKRLACNQINQSGDGSMPCNETS